MTFYVAVLKKKKGIFAGCVFIVESVYFHWVNCLQLVLLISVW